MAACKDFNENWSPIVEGECTKETVSSEGLFECQDSRQRVLLQHCPQMNLQVAQICVNRQWLFSYLSVMCVRVRPYSLSRMRVMVWTLAQERFLHCNATGRVTLCMCYNCLDHWGTQQSETTLFGMYEISIPQVGEGTRLLVCLLHLLHNLIILIAGFFCLVRAFFLPHLHSCQG